MTRQKDRSGDADGLRRRAEEMAGAGATSSPGHSGALSSTEAQRLLHDLQVQQIELEMQNEELRRAQVDLEAASQRYFELYDLAPVGYCTVSERGLILEANLTAAKLLGVARGALVKQPLYRFVLPDDRDIHHRHLKRLSETGSSEAWELRLLRAASAPFWARVEASAAQDADGRPVIRAVVSDISERKSKEVEKAELEAQKRQLELRHGQMERLARQRLESVGTLARGIAHDFNNLLGMVVAQADLALAELASGSCPEEALKRILAAAIRGSEVSRQLMVYAGEEGEILELVDVSQLVTDMLELLEVSVSKRAVLKTDFGHDLPAVNAGPAQLRRVVMNLITNASEAIGDVDGVIRVSTRRETVGQDSAMATSEGLAAGDYLKLVVSDTGRGMTPEALGSVFDPLFTTKSARHGLGLTFVREVVRSLRGGIRVDSTPGKGSTFEIFLPCANHSGQLTRDVLCAVGAEALQSPAGTILIVEDEESLRQPVSQMIRKRGYSVIEAGDGSAAVELICQHSSHINVLVLDLTLPGASSREVFEAAARLRPDMRVIVTSAYSAAVAAESLGGRVEHFIRKPYRLDDLLALIGRARNDRQA